MSYSLREQSLILIATIQQERVNTLNDYIHFFSNFKFNKLKEIESVSLITTGKFSHLLFDSVLSHFTFDWK
jgi:hypothetical protein